MAISLNGSGLQLVHVCPHARIHHVDSQPCLSNDTSITKLLSTGSGGRWPEFKSQLLISCVALGKLVNSSELQLLLIS